MSRKVFLVAAVLVVAACRSSTETLVVRVDSEAAGDNCAQGGVAIRTGYDANNSTSLDDSEVDASKTKYVCNGVSGAAGQNGGQGDAGVRGHNSLNKVTTEAAGTNCANGGSKVETGLDVNDDGTLEASEVTATAYVCSQSSADDYFFGDLAIRSDDDIALLDGKRVVFGSLIVEHATAGVLSLVDLEAVTGGIYVGEGGGGGGIGLPAVRALTPVRELHLPKLISIGELDVGDRPTVTVIDLPELTRAGSITVGSLPALTSLAFPKLTQTDRFRVMNNETLATLSVPLLVSTTFFQISYNEVLATVTISPSLTVTNDLRVFFNDALNDCPFRALRFNGNPRYNVDIDENLATAICTSAQLCRAAMVPGVANVHQCAVDLSFEDANTYCGTVATGATLVWFESAAEWTAFSAAVSSGALFGDAWIGYTDEVSEDTWVAVGGTSTYNPATGMGFWAPLEPNGGMSQNAAQVYPSGLVDDTYASSHLPFYCRAP